MILIAYWPMTILAQAAPWEEAVAAPTKPVPTRISFSDLQEGMRAYQSGDTDQTFRNCAVVMLVVVALFVIVMHFRNKRQNAGPLDSQGKLGRELSRIIPFPMGARLALWWVARSTKTPFATLLISMELFDRNVTAWASGATFALARRWGKGRLERLRPLLFE